MQTTESKVCPYCHEDTDECVQAFGAFWLYFDKFDGWCIHAGKCKPRPINFCPICGRELRKEVYQ
jgi:hypothetical protein